MQCWNLNFFWQLKWFLLQHRTTTLWQCVKILTALFLEKSWLIPQRINTFINVLIHKLYIELTFNTNTQKPTDSLTLTLTVIVIIKAQRLRRWPCSVAQVKVKVSNSGYIPLTQFFSVTSDNITINHILPKTSFFGIPLCGRQFGSFFNHSDVTGVPSVKINC